MSELSSHAGLVKVEPGGVNSCCVLAVLHPTSTLRPFLLLSPLSTLPPPLSSLLSSILVSPHGIYDAVLHNLICVRWKPESECAVFECPTCRNCCNRAHGQAAWTASGKSIHRLTGV